MITSKTNPKIKNVVKLQKSSERREQNRIIIEGRREIERAVACGFVIDTLFICNEIKDYSSELMAQSSWLIAYYFLTKRCTASPFSVTTFTK